MKTNEAATFHILSLSAVQPLVTAFSKTCLDNNLIKSRSIDFAKNSALFTVDSVPRNISAFSGLGATIDATTENGAAQLVDLCSMTENTILGLNDPWVKLKQISYLLSMRPHYMTIRLGCDLYYRVAQRILRCFEKVSNKNDYVINMRECTNSGAIDLAFHVALKAAENSPKRRKLASFKGSFHGSNLGPILASDHQPPNAQGRIFVEKADNVEFFPIPQVNQEGELTESAMNTLSILERTGDLYFAVILEPIQWRNVVHVVPTLFLKRLREICTQKSICLIFDEVQNCFGYTGTICFSEICGVCPDISVLGKGLTSGHGALSIMVAKQAFKEHESPFGFKSNSGNMLSLVAVDAVLDRLLGLEPEEAEMLPKWLPSKLVTELQNGLLSTTFPSTVMLIDELFAELQRQFPSLIGASKGIGLLRGLIILGADGKPSFRLAAEAVKISMKYGVHFRQADTAIFIKPCIVITKAEVDKALISLSRTFKELLYIRDEVCVNDKI